jgi:two-component system chemotaxis response regulator CheY
MSTQYANLRVFLVEPSSTQQHIIKNYLQQTGITDITCCESGEEVFDSLKRLPVDLIISAMYLPDMTGSELLYKLREEDDGYNMAFMLISSETNLASLEPIRQAGAIAILPKPFVVEELQIALAATVDYLNPEKAALDYFDIEDIAVLLVDDSPLALKYISRILSDIGIENMTQVNDGSAAIALLEQSYFDLIVTDYNMPDVDGLQLTTYIRDQSEQKTIPIIMITSERDSKHLAAIKHAGVSAILDKPFEPASIRSFIVSLLN